MELARVVSSVASFFSNGTVVQPVSFEK